jgi:hypothetical protein
MRSSSCLLLSVTLTMMLSACSKNEIDLSQVTGVITLDGQPLESAQIEFTPEAGRISIGTSDAAGRYHLRYTNERNGALHGKHKVSITTALPPVQEEGAPWTKGRKELLPARYNSKTELTAEVKPGKNDINFELTSK